MAKRPQDAPKAPKLRMNTVYLSEFHYAAIDYLVERSHGKKSRSDIIRQALEPYLVQSEVWEPEAFRRFVEERAETLKEPQHKAAILEDLTNFLELRVQDDGSTFQMADPSELDVATSSATFKL